jgi:hypothetical protein
VQEGEAASLQGARQVRQCGEASWQVTASVQGACWVRQRLQQGGPGATGVQVQQGEAALLRRVCWEEQ